MAGPTRGGEVDWGRHVRRDRELASQVLWALVGINVAVFVAWTQVRGTFLQRWMVDHFVVSVDTLAHLRVWTLLTAEFSHRDPTHLLFNLLGLWMFGQRVGDALGARHLLSLYVGGAVAASLAHVAFMLAIGAPNGAIGASGAVMALAVAFARLYPTAVLQLYFFVPVPAPIAVGLFVVLDVLGLFGGGTGNVANAAHLGGAAFGFLYLETLRRR
jgi:membrane associated rhomboid family serine protease